MADTHLQSNGRANSSQTARVATIGCVNPLEKGALQRSAVATALLAIARRPDRSHRA